MGNPLKWTAAVLRGSPESARAEDPWRAAAKAIAAADPVDGAVIGPREFSLYRQDCLGYDDGARLAPGAIGCLVVHKGAMREIAPGLLGAALWTLRPIYANEVFVVLARRGPLLAPPEHMASFYDNLAGAMPERAAHPHLPAPGRSAPVYLGDHTALVMTTDGLKLYVDTRDISLAPHLLLDGMWEPSVTAAVKAIVKQGMRVADIGANFGYFATLMGRLVGSAGWVHCFEPNRRVFDLLHSGMEINGLRPFSTCHRLALLAEPGRRTLKVWRRHIGGSSFRATKEWAAAHNDDIDEVEVAAARLDDVLAGDLRLDFIKIDAEGSEPAVLEGARRTLAANRNIQIVMEFAPAFYGGHDEARAVLAALRGHGFALATVEDGGRIAAVAPGADDGLLERPLSELYLCRG